MIARARYYLHGDECEADPAHYYCARCDTFDRAEHFEHGRCPFDRAGRGDAEMIERGKATMRGDTVPAWLALSADPPRAARECRTWRRSHYYRHPHAPTVWNRARD